MRRVIKSKLTQETPLQTIKLYFATIVANSLIQQMMAEDYQSMIKLFLSYEDTFKLMQGEKTKASDQILTNLVCLFSNAKLHPKILDKIQE